MRIFTAKIEGAGVFIQPTQIEEYANDGYLIEEEGVGIVFTPGDEVPREFIERAIEEMSQVTKGVS